MLVRISQDGHVIIPPFLLEAFGLGPDDELELEETEDGFTLKPTKGHVKPPPKPVDWSKHNRTPYKVPPGIPPLDMGLFRESLTLDRVKYLELYRAKYPESGCDPAKNRD